LMEAMSAECIPITFNNSAMPYIITSGVNGFIVKNKNIKAFSSAIQDFYLLNHSRQELLRKNAKESVQKYLKSWEEVCENFIREIGTVRDS